MNRRFISVVIAGLFFLGSVGMVTAAKKGNPRKGKYLYRKNCRVCHKEGAKGNMVGKPLSPNSKTQAQWKRAFKNYKKFKCSAEWDKRSEKDLRDIYSYLHGHAFDSPSPAKCQ